MCPGGGRQKDLRKGPGHVAVKHAHARLHHRNHCEEEDDTADLALAKVWERSHAGVAYIVRRQIPQCVPVVIARAVTSLVGHGVASRCPAGAAKLNAERF